MMPKTILGKTAFWTFVIVGGVYMNLTWNKMERQEVQRKAILAEYAKLNDERVKTTNRFEIARINAKQDALTERARALAIELGRIKE